MSAATNLLLVLKRGGVPVANTVAPSHDYEGISPNVGDTATVTPGTWSGSPVLTYQWRRNGVDIGGETGLTYDFVDADFGLTVDVIEIPNGDTGAAVASAATGAVVYPYLLRVEFATDDAAPITSPYAGEVGELTFTDAANVSVASSALTIASTNDTTAQSGTIARQTGLGMSARAQRLTTPTDNRVYVAFGDALTNGFTLGGNSSSLNMLVLGAFLSQRTLAEDTPVDITVICRAAGYAYFADEELLWISDIGTTDPVRAYIARGLNRAQMQIDHVRVRRMGGIWDTDEGIASVNESAPASGTAQTATADTIAEFTFALPGSPSAGDEISLDYRITDASNKWRAILKRNVGNTAWDFLVRTVTAGVEATPAGWTDVTGVGTPTRIRVNTRGAAHYHLTRAGTTYTARGATFDSPYLQSATGVAAVYAAGTTSTSLKAYPRTSANYDGVSF